MRAHTLPARIGIRAVLELSWPICVSMLSFTAMTVADTLFVGQLGTAPLAAIGLAAALVHAATAFGNGLLGGMRVLVAKSTGANHPQEAGTYGWQGLWLALGMGAICALAAPAGPWIFPLMGGSAEVTSLASEYYLVRTVSAPLVFLFVSMSAWFQGRGDTRTPMVASVIGNATNVALDPVLIFGWFGIEPMGLTGAGLATAIGMGTSALVLLLVGFSELRRQFAVPSRVHLGEIWRIGSPTGIQQILDVMSFAWFASLLAWSGDAHLAAHVVVVRIAMISFLPGYAVGEASGVLVGQALGARQPWLARDAHRSATQLAVGMMLACGLAFVAFSGPLVAVFGAEAMVAEIARDTLMIAAALQVMDAIATVALGSLAGAGDTRFVMGITVGATWLCKVPVATALVLGAGLGAPGAWLGLSFEIAVLAVIAATRIRGGRWLAA